MFIFGNFLYFGNLTPLLNDRQVYYTAVETAVYVNKAGLVERFKVG
jgi:hypothetical protein